jgi:hypothetical protein
MDKDLIFIERKERRKDGRKLKMNKLDSSYQTYLDSLINSNKGLLRENAICVRNITLRIIKASTIPWIKI